MDVVLDLMRQDERLMGLYKGVAEKLFNFISQILSKA